MSYKQKLSKLPEEYRLALGSVPVDNRDAILDVMFPESLPVSEVTDPFELRGRTGGKVTSLSTHYLDDPFAREDIAEILVYELLHSVDCMRLRRDRDGSIPCGGIRDAEPKTDLEENFGFYYREISDALDYTGVDVDSLREELPKRADVRAFGKMAAGKEHSLLVVKIADYVADGMDEPDIQALLASDLFYSALFAVACWNRDYDKLYSERWDGADFSRERMHLDVEGITQRRMGRAKPNPKANRWRPHNSHWGSAWATYLARRGITGQKELAEMARVNRKGDVNGEEDWKVEELIFM